MVKSCSTDIVSRRPSPSSSSFMNSFRLCCSIFSSTFCRLLTAAGLRNCAVLVVSLYDSLPSWKQKRVCAFSNKNTSFCTYDWPCEVVVQQFPRRTIQPIGCTLYPGLGTVSVRLCLDHVPSAQSWYCGLSMAMRPSWMEYKEMSREEWQNTFDNPLTQSPYFGSHLDWV